MFSESPMQRLSEVHLEKASQLDNDCKMVAAEGREGEGEGGRSL